jgi:L-lactate dehydrogenase
VSGSKVAIIGAGSVGATIAYACQIRGAAQTIALYDVDAGKTRAQVLDLNHGLQFTPVASVVGSDDLEVLRGADVVVLTAGAKQKPGQTRLDLAGVNVAMVEQMMSQFLAVAPDAVYLVVTNPCDVVTYAALRASGLPPSRVFGSGTVLDSSRLRYLVAQRCGVAVQNVHAFMLGEHGDSEIAVWSGANVAQQPLDQFRPHGREPLTPAEMEQVKDQVVHAAYEIIAGKGATWYAVGLAVTRIVEALVKDENRVLPVSVLLQGYKGIHDVCLSVPCVVAAGGITRVLDIPMSDGEVAGLRASADQVRAVTRSLVP